MAKLTRVTAKIFGETADATLTDPEIGQFGSAKAGTYNGTGDVATIQGLTAWSNGWIDAVTPTQQFPPLPEMTGVHKVLSYQNAYLLQQGIPEWDSATTYYENSFCQVAGIIYRSKTDNNLDNNPTSDTDNWEEFVSGGSSRNIGEIVQSTIPLTDAGLHLLDGALIDGTGIYSAFVDYIASIYDASASYFTTEASWQDSVTNYGVCGKFVYDSVNNTVRLPKYNSKIYTGGGEAPVVGNGMSLGLTDGTLNSGVRIFSANNNEYYGSATNSYGANVGTSNTSVDGLTNEKVVGVTSDPTKSGLIAQLSDITTSVDGYYYIVVATSTKTDIQVDIDEIVSDLNGKVDKSSLAEVIPVIKESVSGRSGYRIWASGYCEQWGYSSTQSPTINFVRTFANTNYGFRCQGIISSGVYYQYHETSRTTNSLSLSTNFSQVGDWKASGYLAPGEYE